MLDRETSPAQTAAEVPAAGGYDDASYARGVIAEMTGLLPGEAGLMVADEQNRLRAVTTGARVARDLFGCEERLSEGPTVICYRSGDPAMNEPVAALRARCPRYAALATAAGVRYVTALPMRSDTVLVGAVSVLHRMRLTAADISLTRVLAEAAAVSVLEKRRLRHTLLKVEQLQRALDSRVRIEQAKGAVAARLAITPDAAFRLLRGYARRHNMKLAEVASLAFDSDLAEQLRDRA